MKRKRARELVSFCPGEPCRGKVCQHVCMHGNRYPVARLRSKGVGVWELCSFCVVAGVTLVPRQKR